MSNKFFVSSVVAISSLLVGLNSLVIQPATAIELPDGKKAFESSPRLTRTAATFSNRNNPLAKYQFRIEVPEDAGEALKSVQITQKKSFDTVVFQADKTKATLGSNLASTTIPLTAVEGKSKSGEITVLFDTPVEPGNTVTISIKPNQNPSVGGVYLFGVTAFPAGENSPGLYLGSSRIHIYQ